MGRLGDAFELAATAHEGQKDRAGDAYLAHVVRVMSGVAGETDRIVALLHDTVEDSELTEDAIRARFGDEIARAVAALTHPEGEPLEEYIARVNADPLALRVKWADLADNANPNRLARLDAGTRARLEAKYTRQRELLKAIEQ